MAVVLDEQDDFLAALSVYSADRAESPVASWNPPQPVQKIPPPSETNNKIAQHIAPEAPPDTASTKVREDFNRGTGKSVLKDVDITAKGKNSATNAPLPKNGLAVAQPEAVSAAAAGATLGAPLEKPLPQKLEQKPAPVHPPPPPPPPPPAPAPVKPKASVATVPVNGLQGQIKRATEYVKFVGDPPGEPREEALKEASPMVQTSSAPQVPVPLPPKDDKKKAGPAPPESIKNIVAPEVVQAPVSPAAILSNTKPEEKVVSKEPAPSEKKKKNKGKSPEVSEEEELLALSDAEDMKVDVEPSTKKEKEENSDDVQLVHDSDAESNEEEKKASSSSESESDKSLVKTKSKKKKKQESSSSEEASEFSSDHKSKKKAKKKKKKESSSEDESEDDNRKALREMVDDEAEESSMGEDEEENHKGDEEVASDEASLGEDSDEYKRKKEKKKKKKKEESSTSGSGSSSSSSSSDDSSESSTAKRMRKQDAEDGERISRANKEDEEDAEDDSFIADDEDVDEEVASDDGIYAPLADHREASDDDPFVAKIKAKYVSKPTHKVVLHRLKPKRQHVIESDSELERHLEQEAEIQKKSKTKPEPIDLTRSDTSSGHDQEPPSKSKKRKDKEKDDSSSPSSVESESDSDKKKKKSKKKSRKEEEKKTDKVKKRAREEKDKKSRKKKEEEEKESESSSSGPELSESEVKNVPKPASAKKVPLPGRPTATSGEPLDDSGIMTNLNKLIMSYSGNVFMTKNDAPEKERDASVMVQDIRRYQEACAQGECSSLMRTLASVYRAFFYTETKYPPPKGFQSLNSYALRYLDLITSASKSPIPRRMFEFAKDPNTFFIMNLADQKKFDEIKTEIDANNLDRRNEKLEIEIIVCDHPEEKFASLIKTECRFNLVATLQLILFAHRPTRPLDDLIVDYARKVRSATFDTNGKFHPSFVHIATTGSSEMQSFVSKYDKKLQAFNRQLVTSFKSIKEQVEAIEKATDTLKKD